MTIPTKIHLKLEDYDHCEQVDWSTPLCRPQTEVVSNELTMTTQPKIVDCQNCKRLMGIDLSQPQTGDRIA